MFIKSISVCLLLLLSHSFVVAQNFGGHPPTVKWLQINTENVRVIFPEGRSKEATRVASLINYINANKLQSVGNRTEKIDLVLQTNQVQSNGYVGLLPFRSEFYSTPNQNQHRLSTVDWLDILSIHEYRHALQYSNAKRGATKVLYFLSGETGWATGINLGIPNWYFEGDAVVSETVLSASGRGRTPAFFKEQRALLLSDKMYSYMKARNGSYKDLMPNHYPLGYAIMNYGRNNFGQNVWKDVLADAGAYRTIIYPFSGAMKKHTGMRAPEMYRRSYSELQEQWADEVESITLTEHSHILPNNTRTVTNDIFANYLNNGSIVYISSSYKKTPAIFLLQNGNKKRLTAVGSSVENFLSENNGKLAWTEVEYDPRWSNLTYNKIVTYDIEASEKKVVLNNSKFFSPQFSYDGNYLVATHYDNELSSKIKILNASNGEIIKVLENNEDLFISYPSWTIDDKAIVFIGKKNSQVSILKYDLETNQTINLTEWTPNAIGRISVGVSQVVFSASFTGIDNIFSVDLIGNKKISQLSSVKVGAYQPDISVNGKSVIMSEFTNMGYTLSELDLSNALDSLVQVANPVSMQTFNISLSKDEGNILENIPQQDYEEESYKGFINGTKLHSWGLVTEQNSTGLQFGFKNILNDFNATIAGKYNRNEEAYRLTGELQYAKYFTVFNLGIQAADRRTTLITDISDTLYIFTKDFSQLSLSAGLSIPLLWQRGNYTTGFNFSSDLVTFFVSDPKLPSQLADGTSTSPVFENFTLNSLETGFTFYNLERRAVQNLQSRFGQYIFARHSTSVNDISGERFNIQAGVYLPGFFPNHGFLFEVEYQKELLENSYQFLDYFNYARGYGYPANDTAQRFSVNYQLPLIYPDWGFFNMAYFKRVKVNLFYDVAEAKINLIDDPINQSSYGLELISENILGNILPVNFIGRYSLLPDALPGRDSYNFEFFFQASF